MQTNITESIQALISYISSQLVPIYLDSIHAKNIAWSILQFVTNYTKAQLLINSQIKISEVQLKKIKEIIKAHVEKHKPLQYIFKHIPFLDLTIELKPGTLIPRPETEHWCNELIEDLKRLHLNKEQESNLTFLDLCTGTGCIGLSLAKAFPTSKVYTLDISHEACDLTHINSQKNKIHNVTVLKSDLYSTLPKEIKFDLIVSNPPYISYKRWQNLEPMVKKWENSNALTTKNGGTYIIKKIIKEAQHWLKHDSPFRTAGISQLVIEMDDNQAKKITKLLKHYGFNNIIVKKDLGNMDRVIEASIVRKRF